MANVTISSLTIAIVWFIVMVVIVEPALTLVVPANFTHSYYGTNATTGIVNSTISNFKDKIQIPLAQQANSSAGFGAASNLQVFSGLAFVYGAYYPPMFSISVFIQADIPLYTRLTAI